MGGIGEEGGVDAVEFGLGDEIGDGAGGGGRQAVSAKEGEKEGEEIGVAIDERRWVGEEGGGAS